MIILKANKNDLPEILLLQKLAFHQNAVFYNDFNLQPLLQTLDELYEEAKNSVILKAVADNKIIGSVRGRKENDFAHISKLIVHPNYQNLGYGSKLMGFIEKEFKVKKFKLFTGYLDAKNIYLYEKLGYKICGKEKASKNLFLIHMEKLM